MRVILQYEFQGQFWHFWRFSIYLGIAWTNFDQIGDKNEDFFDGRIRETGSKKLDFIAILAIFVEKLGHFWSDNRLEIHEQIKLLLKS